MSEKPDSLTTPANADDVDRINALLADAADPAIDAGGQIPREDLGTSQVLGEHSDAKRAVNSVHVVDDDLEKPQGDRVLPNVEQAGTPKPDVEADPDSAVARGKVKPILDKAGYEIPKSVKVQYVTVDGKFVDRKSETVHFEDTGRAISTTSEDRKVIAHMVEVARAKNWGELDLRGTEEFRRQAWIAAELNGIKTRGFEPKAVDRAVLEARRQEMRIAGPEMAPQGANAPARAADREIEPIEKGMTGALVAHGAAPYLNDPDNSDSYFVTYLDAKGQQQTTWGVDLERAIEESGAQIGDKVTLENLGKQPVTLEVPVKDRMGNVVGTETKQVHRNSWDVQVDPALGRAPVPKPENSLSVPPQRDIPLTPEESKAMVEAWKEERKRELEAEQLANIKAVAERMGKMTPAEHREHFEQMRRELGVAPASVGPAAPAAVPADEPVRVDEAALRKVLEADMAEKGYSEDVRISMRATLESVFADARASGKDLQIPVPQVIEQIVATPTIESEKALPTPAVEVER